MSPFEYIKNYVVTRIKPSSTHGVGVFAIKDIKKGEFVFQQWLGETGIYKITNEEFKQLSILQQLYLIDMFSNKNEIRLRNGCYFIFAIPYCFMNYNNYGIGNINAQTGEALCDIKCNEELFTQFIYDGNKTII
jgi:hypothetical protein